MKNGDRRSAAWIKDALRNWKRHNEATRCALMLVSIDPTPSLDEIRTWTDEQCLLAEDWAFNVHLKASDNNNRVPAVPEHLKPYQRVYPHRAPQRAAKDAVDEMSGDNGVRFKPTPKEWKQLEEAIARMMRAGCFFTDAEISLFAAGAEHEAEEHFSRFDGYAEARQVMVEIFENRVAA